ncbi:stachyose synthase-like [Vigna radiata var. radiata]|uniref:Stachyose synthase-like n=1 Tax=Vigna radiata var. radiata TaxID=3916 RepID=A0A3Q0EYS0_VIGRR|nr:stachyose synthase-like [Vigna radiata var. radiata]
METQWLLIEVPETESYVVIIPIVEKSFSSPGFDDHVKICTDSCSTQVRASSFDAIAYVHVAKNPYNLMREAYSALRVHLDSFRLLEEKTVPRIVDKFEWCTWDVFYVTANPVGVWHGLKDFSEGDMAPRFVIINDGWQSVNFDDEDPNKDAKNLVLGGEQMTARLHRFEEGDKFKKYQKDLLLGPNAPSFNPETIKKLIWKGIEVEHLGKQRAAAISARGSDLAEIELMIVKVRE